MIDFPGSDKFSFFLDRKYNRITLDVNSKSEVYSKHFEIKELNETSTIKNLGISFKNNAITISIDCEFVSEQEVDFNLSEIYQSQEEPSVKLFRERKYPLYVESEFEDCEKILKKQTHLLRKMDKKHKKIDDEKYRKRDLRNQDWYARNDRDDGEDLNAFPNRGDIPM